jgi:hypothetical protein
VSIGDLGPWRGEEPMTRIVITGLLAATTPAQRRETVVAFEEALLTDAEWAAPRHLWRGRDDGFDPWLGSTIRAA